MAASAHTITGSLLILASTYCAGTGCSCSSQKLRCSLIHTHSLSRVHIHILCPHRPCQPVRTLIDALCQGGGCCCGCHSIAAILQTHAASHACAQPRGSHHLAADAAGSGGSHGRRNAGGIDRGAFGRSGGGEEHVAVWHCLATNGATSTPYPSKLAAVLMCMATMMS